LGELGETLFLLSSADRMKLLAEIRGGDKRLTDLAGKLSATAQETSKHLGRLVDGGLIEKSPGGSFRMTSYGNVIFDLMPSLNFMSAHQKYFLTHDISSLPQQFILRIGELEGNSYVEHVTNVITECQHLLGMAHQYFFWIADQPLPWAFTRAFPDGMSVRVIMQSDLTQKGYQLLREIVGPMAELRFADKVKVGVAVNEKIGGLVFPDLAGRTDFSSGFIGHTADFQRWCSDLFDYYWSNARKTWPSQLEAYSR